MLPSALGMKPSVLLLTIGYAVGYAIMGLTGAVVRAGGGVFMVGIAKGSVINTCTILVSDHSADRTRGMNLMHSCYACGALLCPSSLRQRRRVSTELAVFLLAALGLVLWLVYAFTPLGGGKTKNAKEKQAIDWSFLRSPRFWLLTGLLFFQNAAEQSVNGWMVTYFKGSGIIAGTLAALHRHGDVGRHAGGPSAHRVRVPVQEPAQGHGGHERAVHRVLCAAGAWPTRRAWPSCCCLHLRSPWRA